MDKALSNPFAVLGLPVVYDLTAEQIEQAYFEHSKRWHPDQFASAPAAERIAALNAAAAVNDAYKALKKPVPRATALLAQNGVVIGDQERLEPAFLMEILDLREALAEASAQGHLGQVATMAAEMQARRSAELAKLQQALGSGQWHVAKQHLIVLRYVDRYLQECDSALEADD